jgi:hypothetical protein
VAEIPVPVLPGQFGLFTPERQLLGLLEAAVLEGRFEEARGLRDKLAVREGASPDTTELSVLDRLGDSTFWAQPVEACIDAWRVLDSGWNPRPHVRAQLREGILRRLIDREGAIVVALARPGLLAPVVNFLGKQDGGIEDGRAEAVLRDALALGCAAAPNEFDDPRFVDLLAEDRSSRWLASIGALNRLWPVPALPSPPAPETMPPLAEGDEDDERAQQFWECLRRVVSVPRDSASASEARKRMKVLDSVLHAQFMCQGVERE